MNVLISGASVAGPALAYWLNRHGVRTTIVERADAVRPGGLAVDFRGTAMRVLDQMGILDELRAHATLSGDASVVDADGNHLATMPGAIFAGELEVLKADLTRILHDLTRHDTEYVFGDSIATLTQDADGVRVEFERGAPRSFDLVVGADGLHSRVRTLAFGPKERFTHPMGYAFATFSTDNYLNLDRTGMSHVSGDRSLNVFAASHNALLRVMLMFPAQDVPRDRAAQEEAIRLAYEHVGWEAKHLVAAMPAATDFYFDELSQITMPSWSSGRVALVGDAGYCASPMSGRGTSQALLGAYVLAGELSTQDTHEMAFAEYERALRDYVAGTHEMGRQARDSFTIPVSQELFDAIAAMDTGEDSPDDIELKDYANLTIR
ncbi:FAD-dependent monooxygenase [Actinophytocola oryzae]|uniref:2-polyprenyl-6-methoxyphenol hydroxylase-like FAD-dependent oxidoreductase n=1 Tax=Actinophytocola oryzae TaxID=502181 RepID=A0A4V3FRY7_9PSEU|nr:FAD-dependent monooxygenase [Actinophytocola oryzae]TDV45381.1 2-polyprenyl-6-methoxyphenol hydroxylase-like FAD-dependent oxidoreductase [Actinophytocola oryzae]